MKKPIKYEVEGPLMAICSSDVSKFTLVVHPDDKVGECKITGKKEDGVLRGFTVSDGFAPTQDLRYLVSEDETGYGYTHRLSSTGETLNEQLGGEDDLTKDAPPLFGGRGSERYRKKTSFCQLSRQLHNLRILFAVRVNGRWAIVGGDGFEGMFLSCGYTKEDGEVVRSEYGWEFEVERQPFTICYLDGEIKEMEEE